MADYRHSEFWCKPAFGMNLAEIPDETQGLIYEKEDGTFGVILPVVSEKYKCVLKGETTEEGKEVVLAKLFSWFEGMTDCKGLWHANEIGASPDGRRKGEPFGTNFSASLFAKINGPLSVIQSFTKPDFTENINGGPLTLEFASSMFADEDSVKKVAALVKAYIDKHCRRRNLCRKSGRTSSEACRYFETYGWWHYHFRRRADVTG